MLLGRSSLDAAGGVPPTPATRTRMTSFFPDLNVWLALFDAANPKSAAAWTWFNGIDPHRSRLVFCRYTQIGLLRLLTNRAVMANETLSLEAAWTLYSRWLADPAGLREALAPLWRLPASKWIGDAYLLAFARGFGAILDTFNKALLTFAESHGYSALSPA